MALEYSPREKYALPRFPYALPSRARPVAHLHCHFQVLRVVRDGLGIVAQRIIRDAEGAVDKRSIVRHGSPHGGCHRPGRCSISNTRIWSAVGFAAVRVPAPARAAAAPARAAACTRPCASASASSGLDSPLCPAFHALIWQHQRERVRVGEGERRGGICVCVCVYLRARARAPAHVYVTYTHSFSHIVSACAFH